jgi:N-acyl-D-amino-acid deacylase
MLLSVGEERHLAPWRTFQEYFRALDDLEMSVNVAPLIGHSQVRRVVIGSDDREPTLAQMDVMRGYVAEAMQAGAFGLSTGLIYAPGIYAKTPEISELARVAGQYGGLYATHLRSEADLMVDALMEAMTVGRESGLRVQVAHHKASGRRNWGLVKTTLDIMEYSRKLGVEVTCDVYPYTPSGAGIYSLMPAWARVRGVSGIKEFVSNPATRERIRKELARPSLTWENILFDAGFDEIFVTRSEVCPQYEGKTLAGIAREQSKDPMDLLLEIAETDVNIGMMAGGMSEDDMQYVLRHRLSMVCSDSRAVPFGVGCPHPRNYAAFTRAFATYARDQASLRVEEAVYKMSGFPAWKLGLHDRGVIRPGAKADIAVFDYWAVNSQSTFGDPHHYSDGTVHVMVNGRLVIKDGQVTPALPGRALRRPC